MHQTKYTTKLLEKFRMSQSNLVGSPCDVGLKLEKNVAYECVDPTTYRKIMGSLRYLCHTRVDLNYNVGAISRFI